MARTSSGREDVVGPTQRGAEPFPHVRGLAATVQADDRRSISVTPFEGVHLSVLDEHETAPTRRRSVVAGEARLHRDGHRVILTRP